MTKQQAIVTGLDGDLAIIEVQSHGACSQCELSRGCGTGALGRLLGHRSRPLTVRNEYNLKTGDKVVLGIQDKAFLNVSLLIYGLPLLGLMVGGLLAQGLSGNSDMVTIMLAAVGFSSALTCSAVIAKSRFSGQFNLLIVEINGEPKG